jgi:hypothetical protein
MPTQGARRSSVRVDSDYRFLEENHVADGNVSGAWIQQELGLTGRFTTKDIGMVGMAISTPGAKDWWDNNADLIYPDEFCVRISLRGSLQSKRCQW